MSGSKEWLLKALKVLKMDKLICPSPHQCRKCPQQRMRCIPRRKRQSDPLLLYSLCVYMSVRRIQRKMENCEVWEQNEENHDTFHAVHWFPFLPHILFKILVTGFQMEHQNSEENSGTKRQKNCFLHRLSKHRGCIWYYATTTKRDWFHWSNSNPPRI